MPNRTHSSPGQVIHVTLPGQTEPHLKARSSSTLVSPATLNHMFVSNQPRVKLARKPVFQVFCDEDSPKLASTSSKNLRSGRPALESSCLTAQTVVNNKENTIPEFEDRTIPSRHVSRSSTRSRVLGEKVLLASARVNCVDQWDSNIPFTPCGDKNTKPCKLHSSKLQPPLGRLSLKPLLNIDESKRSKPEQTGDQQCQFEDHSFNHDICSPVTQVASSTSAGRHSSSVDVGLDELLSKLEALQIRAEGGFPVDMLDPLPPNATCPGAPKIPAVFTMPLFVADDADFANDNDQTIAQKPTCRHHMSPLAEVTEAYTGLQGGWSPSPETLSPVLGSEVQALCGIPLQSSNLALSGDDHVFIQTDLSPCTVETISFNFQRRREQVTSTPFDQSVRAPAKGLLRI